MAVCKSEAKNRLKCELHAVVSKLKENIHEAKLELSDLKTLRESQGFEQCKSCRGSNNLERKHLGTEKQLNEVLKQLIAQVNLIQHNIQGLIADNAQLLSCHVNTAHLYQAEQKVTVLMSEREQLQEHYQQQLVTLTTRCETEAAHWQSRYETVLSQLDDEKKEKFALQESLRALSEQLASQTEYCTSMGAACCTLLWRLSRHQESIQPLLIGTKVESFLSLTSSTLQSYVDTYTEDIPDETSEESQFIMSLCGIVTNIAASPFGRDYLIKVDHGRQLVTTLITSLRATSGQNCVKLTNLILMALYNLSINKDGVKLVSQAKDLLSILVDTLQGEGDNEVRLNCLRLLQSIVYDDGNQTATLDLQRLVTRKLKERISQDSCGEIRQGALELITDVTQSLTS